MTRQEFINWALSKGWVLDRWGHLQKQYAHRNGDINVYRYRLSRIAVRREIKLPDGRWVRLHSGYFSKLSIGPEGHVTGMAR